MSVSFRAPTGKDRDRILDFMGSMHMTPALVETYHPIIDPLRSGDDFIVLRVAAADVERVEETFRDFLVKHPAHFFAQLSIRIVSDPRCAPSDRGRLGVSDTGLSGSHITRWEF